MVQDDTVFWDFHLNPHFWRDFNKSYAFDVDGMTGANGGDEYAIKLYSSIRADIENCIDEYGCLLSSASGLQVVETSAVNDSTVHLLFSDTSNNLGFTITVAEANGVTLTIGDNDVAIQGIFIVKKDTGYLFAYARLNNAETFKTNIILPFVGALGQVGNCN